MPDISDARRLFLPLTIIGIFVITASMLIFLVILAAKSTSHYIKCSRHSLQLCVVWKFQEISYYCRLRMYAIVIIVVFAVIYTFISIYVLVFMIWKLHSVVVCTIHTFSFLH